MTWENLDESRDEWRALSFLFFLELGDLVLVPHAGIPGSSIYWAGTREFASLLCGRPKACFYWLHGLIIMLNLNTLHSQGSLPWWQIVGVVPLLNERGFLLFVTQGRRELACLSLWTGWEVATAPGMLDWESLLFLLPNSEASLSPSWPLWGGKSRVDKR